ncbi:MAG: hypothetical protein PSV35_04875 [bacterium]|nr:hypothetical protein [bacterium]
MPNDWSEHKATPYEQARSKCSFDLLHEFDKLIEQNSPGWKTKAATDFWFLSPFVALSNTVQ